MSNLLLICIDVGTSFVKLGIYNTEGEVKYQDKIGVMGGDGSDSIVDADAYLSGVIKLLKNVSSNVSKAKICAITVTGQMAGMLCINQEKEPLLPWSSPLDNRSLKYLKEIVDQDGELIFEHNGTSNPYMLSKILWLRNCDPDTYRKTRKYSLISPYISCVLSNKSTEEIYIDQTCAGFTGLYDINDNCWSEELCNKYNIPMEYLPKIVEPTHIIGELCEEYSKILCLPQGIPIVAGCGDKIAGFIGAGVVEPGELADESSTIGALALCYSDEVLKSRVKGIEIIPSVLKGYYYPLINILGSGYSLEWFVNTFGVEFEILEKKMKAIPPGSNRLFCIALMMGRTIPANYNVKGMWLGYTYEHHQEHFYKSMLESYAYEYRVCLNKLKDAYPNVSDEKHIVGLGSGSRSNVWNQIKADVLEKGYYTLARNDATLLGAAILSGNAVGIFKDIKQTAKAFSIQKDTFSPDRKNVKEYAKLLSFYITLSRDMDQIFNKLSEL